MPEKSSPRGLTFAVCLFLAVIVWAVFGQTRHFDFVNYDDPTYVYKSPAFNQGLSWPGVVWVFTHEYEHEWFPVTYVTRMVDSQLYGANAGGHHLTNVLLHAVTASLLFLVLRKMTGTFWRAAFVAAVFAIHPLRVESVAWVVERKDVLSGLFFMLTLWAWWRYVQKHLPTEPAANQTAASFAPTARDWRPDYFLALVFFALGLLSKSMLVTLPCVLLLLDFWPLQRLPVGQPFATRANLRAWWRLLLEKIPFLILSAGACVTTILTEKNIVSTAHSPSLYWRLGNVLLAYTDYLQHLICPVGLAVAYPHSETNPPIVAVIFSALILIIITVSAVAGWRKHPYLLVGWLWYLGMFLPIIDSMQATQNARADRYTYLPQIGLCILITWSVAELLKSWRYRRVVLTFAAVMIIAGLAVGAYIQTGYWQNSVTLWTRTLACTSENSFAEDSLGGALANQENWPAARQHFESALRIKPDYIEAHINLGVALVAQNQNADAIAHFERALQLNPNSADAHYYLGDTLADQGQRAEAIPHFVRALQLKPDYAAAHYDLGLALATQGKWVEAIPHYAAALKIQLDETDARYISGIALANQKKWAEAIALYEQALQRKPDFAEAHYRLGVALKHEGKFSEALPQLQQALTLATTQGNAALADNIRGEIKTTPASAATAPAP